MRNNNNRQILKENNALTCKVGIVVRSSPKKFKDIITLCTDCYDNRRWFYYGSIVVKGNLTAECYHDVTIKI